MARVLVVDDDVTVREVVVSYLLAAGHDVAEAGDGAAALDEHARRRAVLLVLDVMMPGMDGLTCLRAIRAEPAWGDLPVIMYTADFSLDRMGEAMQMGAAAYIVKGTAPWEEVLTLIHQYRRKGTPN